ncbi:MAG: hypothetical protein ACFFDN_26090, partial [Candidatus Hodarchaeota archaeon]
EVEKIPRKCKVVWYDKFVTQKATKLYYRKKKLYNQVLKANKIKFLNYFQELGTIIAESLCVYLKDIYKEILPACFVYLRTSEDLVRSLSPKIMVGVHAARATEISLYTIGKKYGITSYLVHHAVFPQLFGNFNLADKIFLPGKRMKKIVEESGINSSKIRITGTPHWDEIFRCYKKRSRSSCLSECEKNLKIKLKDPIITYTTQPGSHYNIKPLVKAIRTIIRTGTLIIKLHPREKKSVYKGIEEIDSSFRVIIVKDEIATPALLKASNLILLRWSNTLFESLFLGTPIVIINFGRKIPFELDQDIPGILIVKNFFDFKSGLQRLNIPELQLRIINDKRLLKFLDEFVNPTGNATKNIVNIILEDLNKT